MPKIVIIGAGISGRLAKIVFNDAWIFEAKPKDSVFQVDAGVQISIVPIPGMNHERYTRYIEIDGHKPNIDLIQKYRKKVNRDGDLVYGDYRQFEPIQTVYMHEFPDIEDIKFGMPVQKIKLAEKKVIFQGDGFEEMPYDYLLTTVPLRDFIRLTDLFDHFQEQSQSFFMHRPIYLLKKEFKTEDGIIKENYITDPENPVYRENWLRGKHNRESLFKLDGAIKIYPGKIYNNHDVGNICQDLMSYGIFCIGRYAQWDNRIHLWNTYNNLKALKEVLV